MTEWEDLPTLESVVNNRGLLTAACCGRETNSFMIIDLRAMPPGLLMQIEHGVGLYADETVPVCCDGCREREIRTGRIPRAAFYAALGAPPDVIKRARDYENRRQSRR